MPPMGSTRTAHFHPTWLRHARFAGAIVAGLLAACGLASCGTNPTVGTSTVSGGPTATPTATAPATATPIPTTCAALPGFGGATTLTLAHMAFPSGTVAAAPATSGGGDGQFGLADYSACAPHNTTALTVATGKGPEAFTHLLLFYGWAPSPSFPADAEFQTACGGAACFVSTYLGSASDPISQYYLALKSVAATSTGLVTFQLIEATPPPARPCHVPIYDTGPHPYLTGYGGLELPPLTRAGTPDGHAGSVTGYYCSAGSAAFVNAFMAKALPKDGYTPDPADGSGWWKVTCHGTFTCRLYMAPATDPSDWTMTSYAPM